MPAGAGTVSRTILTPIECRVRADDSIWSVCRSPGDSPAHLVSNVQKDTPSSVDPASACVIFVCKIVNCHANCLKGAIDGAQARRTANEQRHDDRGNAECIERSGAAATQSADRCGGGGLHFRRVIKGFGLSGDCIYFQQARKRVAIFTCDDVMLAVFEPARRMRAKQELPG